MTGEDVAVEQLKPSRIVIGSDAWIATQAMVLANVTIGHGAVVGARSVVTADVPPYAIVAGAPARVIRYRFEPEDVTRLLELSWWDWPEVAIRECVPLLRTDDIDGLSRYATAHGL
ncbi:MAG: CatB-related O-acetyltransferase [Coriobacteriia bacterium]|nr:CatB-related O-acetyltransferase [Coriobacteriia bacterium]